MYINIRCAAAVDGILQILVTASMRGTKEVYDHHKIFFT